MKKILSLIFSIAICMTLAACSNNQAVNIGDNSENPPLPAPPTAQETAASEPAGKEPVQAEARDESGEIGSNPESAVYSPDGSFAAWPNVQENLKDENGKFCSIYQVLLSDTRTGNVTVFKIVGRDFRFLWSEDGKFLAVTYSGRIWTHFSIVDTATLTETPGPNMASVVERFKAQGRHLIIRQTKPAPILYWLL